LWSGNKKFPGMLLGLLVSEKKSGGRWRLLQPPANHFIPILIG
jgi:hypothetical protein